MSNSAVMPPAVLVRDWLKEILGTASIVPLHGDASSRRYFRVCWRQKKYIAMHSPLSEQPARFLAVRDFLSKHQTRVPNLIAEEAARGLILLEDFGAKDYLSALHDNSCNRLYAAASKALAHMQTLSPPSWLATYDDDLLRAEIMLYADWFRAQYVKKPLTAEEMKAFMRAADFIINACRQMPQVFVHRDYHSRNLMVVDNDGPGILDFQDAVTGAAVYDIVSLLRDAYISWSPRQQYAWLEEYRQTATAAGVLLPNAADTRRDFNIVGAQRGLKVLGIFARLSHRDGKHGYLKDMPRVYAHLLFSCAERTELSALRDIIIAAPPPTCE